EPLAVALGELIDHLAHRAAGGFDPGGVGLLAQGREQPHPDHAQPTDSCTTLTSLFANAGESPSSAWPKPSPSNSRLGSPAASNSRWACDGGNSLSSVPWTMITGVGAILPI